MNQLTKEAKTRLEEAVMVSIERIYEDPRPITHLHFTRPDKFSLEIVKYINNHGSVRRMLSPDDFMSRTLGAKIKLIEGALRRLYRRGELRKDRTKVKVLLGGSGKKYVADRVMVCYWPVTVLDKLARC